MVEIAVVVPTHNERKRIIPLLEGMPEYCHPIILDDSTDNTAQLAKERGATTVSFPNVAWQFIPLKYLYGLKYARQSGYDWACTMDSGENFDPDWINKLVIANTDGVADIVIGAREFHGRGLRRLISNIASRITGLGLPDSTSGFRLYRLDSLNLERFQSRTPHAFQVELLLKHKNHNIRSVPIPYRAPKNSTMSLGTFLDWARMYLATKGGAGESIREHSGSRLEDRHL